MAAGAEDVVGEEPVGDLEEVVFADPDALGVLASQAIGISPARNLLAAFALPGFVAGLGGALLAIHQENVNYTNNFTPFAALFWLVLVATFSAREANGAVTAAAMFALFDAVVLKGAFLGWILRGEDHIPGVFPIAPDWRFILFGLGAIQYARHPEGILVMNRAKMLRRLGSKRPPAGEPDDRAAPDVPADGRAAKVGAAATGPRGASAGSFTTS